MRPHKRIRELTLEEKQALHKGTKSPSGFTTRRSQMLLLNAEGMSAPQIAQRLHCAEQSVRNVIRAFEREGLGCLQQKSNRPHTDSSAFDSSGLKHLEELVHRSPRDFGFESSQWTLKQLAQACFKEGIVKQAISYETVRQGLGKLGITWKTARHHISSHDGQYVRKKASAAVD
jgi:transposase